MSSVDYPAEVLIADDDPLNRYVLRMYLEGLGCRVIVAMDGHQAVAELRDSGGWIGLVILDAGMPGPSPVELHDQLRGIDPSVPILFCSGVSPHEAISAHGLPLLAKPFSRDDLEQAISEVLKQTESACCT